MLVHLCLIVLYMYHSTQSMEKGHQSKSASSDASLVLLPSTTFIFAEGLKVSRGKKQPHNHCGSGNISVMAAIC